jgi:heme-degrading monooxygenase HmoA
VSTVINRLNVTGSTAEFERTLGRITAFMNTCPGFLSHQLYRSLRNPSAYIEVAHWRDAADHRAAVQSPEFRACVAALSLLATAEPDIFAAVHDEDRINTGEGQTPEEPVAR